MRRDFVRLRASVDVCAVLRSVGVDCKHSHRSVRIRCISGKHVDNNPSLEVRVDPGNRYNGLGHCFACGWGGDIYHVVSHVKRCSIADAYDYVDGMTLVEDFKEAIEYDVNFKKWLPSVGVEPAAIVGIAKDSLCCQYLAGRGIGEVEIARYGLRDWRWRGRVFVPLTRKKTFTSWIARSYIHGHPKVLTPTGGDTRWSIFGYDLLDTGLESVHICEGWVSAIRVWQAGFENAVGLCGSKMTEEKVVDLAPFRKLVVWEEGDHAGRGLTCEIKQWLGRREISVVRLPDSTDPADYSSAELNCLYNERRMRDVRVS